MATINQLDTDNVTTGFRIPRQRLLDFMKRLPRRGDRTRVINQLIQDFLDNKIVVAKKY